MMSEVVPRSVSPAKTGLCNFSLAPARLRDFERQAADSGRSRQTKPTHSPLNRANRRNGQYVQHPGAEIADVVLTFRRVEEQLAAQPEQEGSQERVRKIPRTITLRNRTPEPIDRLPEGE